MGIVATGQTAGSGVPNEAGPKEFKGTEVRDGRAYGRETTTEGKGSAVGLMSLPVVQARAGEV
jgi:hypothetical protein